MKTVVLRIHRRIPEPPAYYPMELFCDGTYYREKIPVSEVDNSPIDLRLGNWGGRDLGGTEQENENGNRSKHAEFATWLFELVFRSDQTKRLFAPPIRLVLDIEPIELRGLYWELIGNHPFFPACVPNCTVIRGRISSTEAILSPVSDAPIKVLVVVGSKPGDEAVQAEAEIKKLKATFSLRNHDVELSILEQPTREEIGNAFSRMIPDIFHFIGHGDRTKLGEPFLVLYDNARKTNVTWQQDRIISDLTGISGQTASFVFLNACHTIDVGGKADAARRAESREVVSSMSDVFLDKLKARGVLGMHAAIWGDTAGELACALYEALFRGQDLELALTTARIKIDRLVTGKANRCWDWALPYFRLGENVRPDKVLSRAGVVREFEAKSRFIPEFQNNRLFVNRVTEHRELMMHLQNDANRASNLLLVKGEEKVGKTNLIQSCLEALATRGRLIKYVKLDPLRQENFLGILRLICTGEEECLIKRPLPSEPMRKFYQTLNALLDGNDPRGKGVLDQYPSDPRWGTEGFWNQLPNNGVEDQVRILFDEFRKSLSDVTSAARLEQADKFNREGNQAGATQILVDERPFVIVLDEVNRKGINGELFRKFLVPHFIKPFAQAKIKDVLLVIALPNGHEQDLGLDDQGLSIVPTALPVERLDPAEFLELAMDYYDKSLKVPKYNNRVPEKDDWKESAERMTAILKKRKERWLPQKLPDFFEVHLKT